MVIEDHDDLRRIKYLFAAHLAEKISSARRAAIVEHNVVGHDVDDFADFDALAIGVARDDLLNGVHPYASVA